jgi:hypothetical protein
MSREVCEGPIEKSEPAVLTYAYYVVFNFVKDGQGGAGSKVYRANSGLTEKLIHDIHKNIQDSEDFENVIILNVVKLDGQDAPVYPH